MKHCRCGNKLTNPIQKRCTLCSNKKHRQECTIRNRKRKGYVRSKDEPYPKYLIAAARERWRPSDLTEKEV